MQYSAQKESKEEARAGNCSLCKVSTKKSKESQLVSNTKKDSANRRPSRSTPGGKCSFRSTISVALFPFYCLPPQRPPPSFCPVILPIRTSFVFCSHTHQHTDPRLHPRASRETYTNSRSLNHVRTCVLVRHLRSKEGHRGPRAGGQEGVRTCCCRATLRVDGG